MLGSFGDRAFRVAAQKLWNGLSKHIIMYHEVLVLVQNGSHFIIPLYPDKLALFASSACPIFKGGKEG